MHPLDRRLPCSATTLFASFALAALFAPACAKKAQPIGDDASVNGAVATPSPAGSVRVDAAAVLPSVAATSEFFAFGPSKGQKRAVWFLAEKTGTTLRAQYTGGRRSDVVLVGKMTDATHFSVKEAAPAKGVQPLVIAGEVTPGKLLTATLTNEEGVASAVDGVPLQMNALAPAARPDGDARDEEYSGALGARRIRMKLANKAGVLAGLYRYEKSQADIRLDGKLANDGSFTLTERVGTKTTGSFRGVMLPPLMVFGRWTSPDASKTFPVTLHQDVGYPETATFDDKVVLFPQESSIDGPRCHAFTVVAQLRGFADKPKEAEANKWLRSVFAKFYGDQHGQKTCVGTPEDMPDLPDFQESIGYALNTKKGRFASLTASSYAYTGGAHGMAAAECHVLDVKTLHHFRLVDLLTADGRKALGKKATDAITKEQAKDPSFKSLTDLGFSSDTLEIGKDTNVCLYPTEIAVEFNAYEVGAWAIGGPQARFPKAEVKPLFEANDETKALFE